MMPQEDLFRMTVCNVVILHHVYQHHQNAVKDVEQWYSLKVTAQTVRATDVMDISLHRLLDAAHFQHLIYAYIWDSILKTHVLRAYQETMD
jgi:hypothetical protein